MEARLAMLRPDDLGAVLEWMGMNWPSFHAAPIWRGGAITHVRIYCAHLNAPAEPLPGKTQIENIAIVPVEDVLRSPETVFRAAMSEFTAKVVLPWRTYYEEHVHDKA